MALDPVAATIGVATASALVEPHEAPAAALRGRGGLEFVVGNRPDQLKATNTHRLRSHLAKQAWKEHKLLNPKTDETENGGSQRRPGQRRKRRKPQAIVEYVYVSNNNNINSSNSSSSASPGSEGAKNLVPWTQKESLTVEYRLGGGRTDPLRSYPVPWDPLVSPIVDHYIVHMAVDIPELDQDGQRGLLRSSWFPLVLSEPSTFYVVLLLAASNLVSVGGATDLSRQLLRLKGNAITCVNRALTDESKYLSDAVIGAVVKMASFEAMHGDVDSYRIHMEGLRNMVYMRGGLDKLGLGGLLRRMVVWVDLNSSFLLQIPRYFPGQRFREEDSVPEPNPARFIAI